MKQLLQNSKENYFAPRILYPDKLPIEYKYKIKTFLDM